MKFKANQIAEVLEGKVIGDPNAEVSKLSKIEEGEKGSLSFLSNSKYNSYIYNTEATIIIVNESFQPEKEISCTMIKVEDAYLAFSKLLAFYDEAKHNKSGRENPHFIGENVTIGKDIYLGAFAYIGNNVIIGDNVKIYPNVYIGDNVTIGNNTTIFTGSNINSESIIGKECNIHSGVTIGSDGFGFAPTKEGTYDKIPQIGNVIIEDRVDIGAATTIDRATLGSTIIRKGVKLDNQIQIAHNVEIDENTVIAAQSGIAGSSKIGKNCMIGGQVGVAGHLTIGDNVKIQAQSGIGRNIKDNEVLQGSPALSYNDYNKSYVHFKNLSKISLKIDRLEKEIKALKNE